MSTFHRLPPCEKSFSYSYYQWLAASELANQQIWEAIPGNSHGNAIPGTLQSQCPSCFYRDAPTVSDITSEIPLDTTLQPEFVDVPRAPADQSTLPALEQIVYLGIDGNESWKRLIRTSPGQTIHQHGNTFVNTNHLRIPPVKITRESVIWQAIRSGRKPPTELSKDRSTGTSLTFAARTQARAPLGLILSEEEIPGLTIGSPPPTSTAGLAQDDPGQQLSNEIYVEASTRVIGCSHKFLAAEIETKAPLDEHAKPRTLGNYDECGLAMVTCRHGVPIRVGNIWRGENQETMLTIFEEIVERLPKDTKFVLQYDLACKFRPYLCKMRPDLADRVMICLNAFHAFAHEFRCQLRYGPIHIMHLARSDGESVERAWSLLQPFVSISRVSGPQHRHDMAHRHNLHTAKVRRRTMPDFLSDRFARVQQEIKDLEVQIAGPTRQWLSQNIEQDEASFKAGLRRKIAYHRDHFLQPHTTSRLIHQRIEEKFKDRPIFTELCRLQKGNFLRAGGTWINLTRTRIERESPVLSHMISTGQLTLVDWERGTSKWQLYFAEVGVVRLQQLREELRGDAIGRKLAFKQVSFCHPDKRSLFKAPNANTIRLRGRM